MAGLSPPWPRGWFDHPFDHPQKDKKKKKEKKEKEKRMKKNGFWSFRGG
jgi:hypothetical protein